jgi:hypothetical protein
VRCSRTGFRGINIFGNAVPLNLKNLAADMMIGGLAGSVAYAVPLE